MKKFLGVDLCIKDLILFVLSTCAVSMYLGGPVFYVLLLLWAFIFIVKTYKGQGTKSIGAILVYVIALLSTVCTYADTSPVFHVEQRIILLLFVIIAFSPAITNDTIYLYRKRLFYFLCLGLCVVGVASSLLSLVGWGYVDGYLRGLSDFPNSLGYTLGITIIFYFSLFLQQKKKKYRAMCLLIIMLCCRTIPLTGTRTAFYSIPIIAIFYLFFSSKTISALIKNTCILAVAAFAFLSVVDLDMSIIDRKNEMQRDSGENSRASLFYARQKEFEQSPIIGYGTFKGDPRYAIINTNGNVEVGNSFLAFLSMNGIVGFVNFMVFYISIVCIFLHYLLRKRREGLTSFEMLLLLIVIYNCISMQQMGLVLNPGLYSTGFNWLTMGLMFKPQRYLQKYR